MNTLTIRQGDVGLAPLAAGSKLPDGLEPVARVGGRLILSQGSATGHAHAITTRTAKLFRDPTSGTVYLAAPDGALLDHEEHTAITLAPGNYEVIQQREYTPEAIRNVSD